MKKNILLIVTSLLVSGTLFAQQADSNIISEQAEEIISQQAEENENLSRPLSETIEDHDIVVPESVTRQLSHLLHDWKVEFSTPDNDNCFGGANVHVSDSVIIARLQALPTVMEMSFNQIVRSQIDAYATRRREQVAHMLALANYYFPIFEEVLERYGLPLELRYLPVIESALNPIAVSRAGAAGLWQFMPRTAQGFGLEINTLVDERRCPHRSTEAAARYLRDLYNLYGDWKLVLAAYNSGMGTVNRAIARSGGVRDYWAIYHRLPRETRGFVPIFIAAVYIMNYYQEHNICPMRVEPLFLGLDTVHVHERIHFEQISEVLDIPVRDLQRLNPKFRRDIIPASEFRSYALVLPTRNIYAFIERKDEIVEHNRNQHFTHRVTAYASGMAATSISGNMENTYYSVRRGDNLSVIARRNGVTVAQLRSWNSLRSDNLSIGQRLIVSRRPVPVMQAQTTSTTVTGNTQTINQYYRVRSGDTLGEIARRHNTTVAQLQRWNGMSDTRLSVNRQLIVGQQIVQIAAAVVEPETPRRESPANITCTSSYIIDDFLNTPIERTATAASIGNGSFLGGEGE
jgi:membrane-bound lytic murein transglycosylase D